MLRTLTGIVLLAVGVYLMLLVFFYPALAGHRLLAIAIGILGGGVVVVGYKLCGRPSPPAARG